MRMRNPAVLAMLAGMTGGFVTGAVRAVGQRLPINSIG
jgi:hypothetical protein